MYTFIYDHIDVKDAWERYGWYELPPNTLNISY